MTSRKRKRTASSKASASNVNVSYEFWLSATRPQFNLVPDANVHILTRDRVILMAHKSMLAKCESSMFRALFEEVVTTDGTNVIELPIAEFDGVIVEPILASLYGKDIELYCKQPWSKHESEYDRCIEIMKMAFQYDIPSVVQTMQKMLIIGVDDVLHASIVHAFLHCKRSMVPLLQQWRPGYPQAESADWKQIPPNAWSEYIQLPFVYPKSSSDHKRRLHDLRRLRRLMVIYEYGQLLDADQTVLTKNLARFCAHSLRESYETQHQRVSHLVTWTAKTCSDFIHAKEHSLLFYKVFTSAML